MHLIFTWPHINFTYRTLQFISVVENDAFKSEWMKGLETVTEFGKREESWYEYDFSVQKDTHKVGQETQLSLINRATRLEVS